MAHGRPDDLRRLGVRRLVLNDIQPKMWVFERRASLLANFAQRSYAASLLAVFYWELRFWLTRRDDRAPFRDNLGEHPGWSRVEAAMAKFAALCRKNGIPFVLVVRESHPRLKSLADSLAGQGGFWSIDLGALHAVDPRWKDATLTISWVNPHHNRLGLEVDSTLLREEPGAFGPASGALVRQASQFVLRSRERMSIETAFAQADESFRLIGKKSLHTRRASGMSMVATSKLADCDRRRKHAESNQSDQVGGAQSCRHSRSACRFRSSKDRPCGTANAYRTLRTDRWSF